MDVLELLKSHTSVRSFLDKPIEEAQLINVLEAAQCTSTSSHVQAYSVVRVTDADKRAALAEAAGGQKWVIAAPEFLVFCADINRLSTISEQEGRGPMEGYTEHSVAAIVDVALFAQSAMVAAESLGLGGVFIGGIRNNPQTVIDTLELPHGVYPVFGMCLGWPDKKNAVKPRLSINEVLHRDTYDLGKQAANVAAYNEEMIDYYGARGTDEPRTWNRTVTDALQNKKREHLRETLESKGFFKK
jgi:nitroreductase